MTFDVYAQDTPKDRLRLTQFEFYRKHKRLWHIFAIIYYKTFAVYNKCIYIRL